MHVLKLFKNVTDDILEGTFTQSTSNNRFMKCFVAITTEEKKTTVFRSMTKELFTNIVIFFTINNDFFLNFNLTPPYIIL